MWKRAGAVALGGALGGVLRSGFGLAFNPPGSTLPWGTLAVNTLGSLALGGLMGAVLKARWLRPGWHAFWTVGLLGSFTTYSALAVETVHLAERSFTLGLFYLGANLLLGLAAAGAGLRGGGAVALRVQRAGPSNGLPSVPPAVTPSRDEAP